MENIKFKQTIHQLTCGFKFLYPWPQDRYSVAVIITALIMMITTTPVLTATFAPQWRYVQHSKPPLWPRDMNHHTAIVSYRCQQAPTNISTASHAKLYRLSIHEYLCERAYVILFTPKSYVLADMKEKAQVPAILQHASRGPRNLSDVWWNWLCCGKFRSKACVKD